MGPVLALSLAFGLHRLVDPDLFLQIAVGRSILANPGSLGVSTFIEAFPGYPYVEDKWLASVIAALIDRLGGANGLMLYQLALGAFVGTAWYAMQRWWRAKPAAAVLGVALAFVTCSFRLEPRPDTISHGLLALTIGLVGTHLPFRKLLWLFPLLLVAWVNLHGYFVNGLLVLLTAAVASFFGDRDLASGATQSIATRERFLLLAAALAACFVHPQGWHATLSPVSQILQLGAEPVLRAAIQEFQPTLQLFRNVGLVRLTLLGVTALAALTMGLTRSGPSPGICQLAAWGLAVPWVLWPPEALTSLPYRVSMALWIMAAMEVPAAFRERRFFQPLLLLGFTALALPMVRNIPLLTPVALILLGPAWTAAAQDLAKQFPNARVRQCATVGMVVVVLAVGWLRLTDRLGTDVRAPIRTGWGIDRDRVPVAAIDALLQQDAPETILNNFDAGGYLLYRLHPARRAFIAGNTSMYPGSYLAYYRANVTGAGPKLQELQTAHGITSALLDLASPAASRLASALAADPSWHLTYFDHAGALFVRSGTAEPGIEIGKHARELADLPLPLPVVPPWLGGKTLPYPGFNLGIFLSAIGRPDLLVDQAVRVWRLAPTEDVAVLGGQAAQQSGRLLEFLPQLEEAEQRFPSSEAVRTLLFLALAFRVDRRLAIPSTLADAESDLRRMLTLQPGNCGPYFALAKAAALRGAPAEAKRQIVLGQAYDRAGTCAQMAASDPALAPLLPR